LVSAGFDLAAALFCVRALLRGVADATCVELPFALAAFGFAAEFGVVTALPLAAAAALLSIDVLLAVVDMPVSIDVLPLAFGDGLAAVDLLVSIDVLPPAFADGLVVVDLPLSDVAGAPVPDDALAVLFFRHSLNAAPSLPMHGADEVDDGGGVVAVLVVDGVYVDCAPTTPAAANAVARSRARGLDRGWFMKASCQEWEYRSVNGPSLCPAMRAREVGGHSICVSDNSYDHG